jgi:hypothetical protein
MKRLIVFLSLFMFSITLLHSQDEITLKSGDVLKAKVLEVGTEEVAYKKFDNLSGPTYTTKKDLVFMIKYENGTKDVFGTEKQGTAAPVTNASSGGTPAIIYFYRPAKIIGSSPDIIVGTLIPDEVIVKLRNGRWYRSEYTHIGTGEFVTGIYAITETKLKVNIEPGKTYYIRCSIMKGLGLQSQLEVVDDETGKKEMDSLKEQEKAK